MIFRSCGDDRFNNSSFDRVEMIAGIFSSTYALLDASKPRPWYAAYPNKPAARRTRTRNRPPIIERDLLKVHLADWFASRIALSLAATVDIRAPSSIQHGRDDWRTRAAPDRAPAQRLYAARFARPRASPRRPHWCRACGEYVTRCSSSYLVSAGSEGARPKFLLIKCVAA
jgi:hypothetical protein